MVTTKVMQKPFFYLDEMADNRAVSAGYFGEAAEEIGGYYINEEDHLRGLLLGKFHNIEPQ
jgi:hypothetical protein